MLYQALKFEKIDHVLVVSIPGPIKDRESLVRLSDGLSDLSSQLAWDEEVSVVVLIGSGEESFSIDTIPPEANPEIGQEVSPSLASSVARIDQPVIAGINGDVMGQGLELAMACDIRIASEKARFGLPQIKEGLIPGDGGTQRLSRLIGKGRALEMVLLGEAIDAAEAYRIGLVHKIVPSDQLMPAVMKMAKEMASKGAIALRYAKEAIQKGMDLTLDQGLRLEADLYLLIHTTKDRSEGINAFREKRPPKFEGK